MSGVIEPTRIRICRTHGLNEHRGSGRCAEGEIATISAALSDGRPCVIVEMVWSSDGSALLAIDTCPTCDGKPFYRESGPSGQSIIDSEHVKSVTVRAGKLHVCPKCGGRGWVYRAALSRTLVSVGSGTPERVAVVRL